MISDEHVKDLYQKSQAFLTEHGGLNMAIPSPPQFFRGVSGYNWKGQHPGSCKRHKSVFFEFNVIPKYCFSCYKVYAEPRTIVELFKLMVLFEQIRLPNDNTRKCMVEDRKEISGTYKGFIYCTGMQEANEMLLMLKKVISVEISDKIPVILKRGCSEYSLVYPKYGKIEQGKTLMEYKNEWQEYEDIADKKFILNPNNYTDTPNNHTGFNLLDARIMLAWMKYAATIGDSSYLKISGNYVERLYGLERSFTYSPVEDE